MGYTITGRTYETTPADRSEFKKFLPSNRIGETACENVQEATTRTTQI